MSQPLHVIGAEHLQAAIDAVLGIDPSQAPTDPAELNERLSIPATGVTGAIEFLFSQQQSKRIHRGAPFIFVILEAANRAYPEEMKIEIKSKPFVGAIAAVTPEAQAAGKGSGAPEGGTKERQPELVAFIDRQLQVEGGWAKKLSLDDRSGLYALCLGTIRAVDRHLLGPDKPVTVEKKPGPNEPCFCGSGKKYKKCHAAAH